MVSIDENVFNSVCRFWLFFCCFFSIEIDIQRTIICMVCLQIKAFLSDFRTRSIQFRKYPFFRYNTICMTYCQQKNKKLENVTYLKKKLLKG